VRLFAASATDVDVKQAVASWLDTWHRFLVPRNTSTSATVHQAFAYKWRLAGGLMCTICYSHAMHTSRPE